MKKYLKSLRVFIISLMLFIPLAVFAETYEYFDFRVERVDGENIKNTEINIYASTASDPTKLTLRTDEFTFNEVMWSVCTDESCDISEEVSDEAVFEEGKYYILMTRIVAKDGSEINVWGTDKVKYNGTPIDELSGEFGNTGNELMIKNKTNVKDVPKEDEKKEEENKEVVPEPSDNKCLFGLSICCTTIFNISICLWILILIVLIIILIIAITALKKKE